MLSSLHAGSRSLSSRNSEILIGGIIGGLFATIIMVTILSIIIVLMSLFLRKGAVCWTFQLLKRIILVLSRTDASNKTEVVYEEPDLKLYRAKKDQDIDLEKCPAYGETMPDQNVELKECPAYGI